MKNRTALSIALLWPLGCLAADSVMPLQVQPGLWEISITSQASGLSRDTLASLNPEQRLKMQPSSRPTPARVHKACITSDDLKKPLAFGDQNKATCTPTVASSTGAAQDYSLECTNGTMKSVGTVHVEALSPVSFRGNSQMTSTDGARNVGVKVSFTGRWVGEQCGDVGKN